ncbi:MAG: phosphatidate cytidylyltransferase [Janthinobacterium lividum]
MSAAVLAPLGLACMWAGGWAWAGLVLLAVAGLGWEWVGLCRMAASRWPGAGVLAGLAVAMLVVATARGAAPVGGDGFAGAVALLVLAGAAGVLAFAPGGRAAAAGGVAWVGVAGLSLLWLRADPVAGRADVLFVMLLVWASDIGAYAAGRSIGGPKLAPRISPGKTWSGSAGGVLAAAVVGGGVAWAFEAWSFGSGVGVGVVARAAAVAAVLAAVSQAGDLCESAVKRRFGQKDSGRLIPGHGGLLDRLDGVLAAAPVAALLALDAGRGMALWR